MEDAPPILDYASHRTVTGLPWTAGEGRLRLELAPPTSVQALTGPVIRVLIWAPVGIPTVIGTLAGVSELAFGRGSFDVGAANAFLIFVAVVGLAGWALISELVRAIRAQRQVSMLQVSDDTLWIRAPQARWRELTISTPAITAFSVRLMTLRITTADNQLWELPIRSRMGDHSGEIERVLRQAVDLGAGAALPQPPDASG